MDRISYYSSEIITQIELGNMKGKDTNVLGINGVGCDGGEDLRGAKRRAGNALIPRVTARSEATSFKNVLN